MSSRTYCVGIPLVVTVSDTGVVTYSVDASEIQSEMSERFGEGEDEGTENEMLLDGAIVAGHNDAGNFTPVTLTQMVRVKCPVRYGCGWEVYSLDEMAAHIDDPDAKHDGTD